MRNKFQWFLRVCLLFAATSVWAQQTGKITGTVLDAQTNDPLPGATVKIIGTTQGAITNGDGEYVIIGVRPGSYTVAASFVGYVTENKANVSVNIGLTSTINFKLKDETVGTGQEVIIQADAVQVRKDVTSSESRVSASTIETLPTQSLDQLVGQQAGVTLRNGELTIRGGRASGVKVMVDGVDMSDSYNGARTVEIDNSSIQELQVISGTFNAEYGNAMSGVINIVTKEGNNQKWIGSLRTRTGSYLTFGKGGEDYLRGENADAYTVGGIQYRDVDPYSYLPINPLTNKDAWLSLDGPIIKDRVSLYIMGHYNDNVSRFYGVRKYNADGTKGDDAIVPNGKSQSYNWDANLKIQLNKNMFMNLSSTASHSQGTGGVSRWTPEGGSAGYGEGNFMKLKFTHLISSKTFYTIDAGLNTRKEHGGLFDDPLDSRYNDYASNIPDSLQVSPGVWEVIPRSGLRFTRGGMSLNRYDRGNKMLLLQGALTSQISKHHLIKTGFIFKQDNMNLTSYDLIPAVGSDGAAIAPFQPSIPVETSFNYNHFENLKPIYGAGYAQDTIEYEDLIINFGIRADYFDSRASILADPTDPNIYAPFKKINIYKDTNGNNVIDAAEETEANQKTLEERQSYWYTKAKSKFFVSPRLAVAYPISADGVIHFSYGIFMQIPTLENMFQNYGYKISTNSGSAGVFGNPDLKPERQNMYEIGFRQGLGDFVLDVTGYYNDTRNWVGTSRVIETEIPGRTYVVFANRDYGNTKGLTLALNRNFKGGWGAGLNYTYQVAEGSASNPGEEYAAGLSGAQPTLALLPLNNDQRHRLTGTVLFGGKNWGGSLQGDLGTGFPYTPGYPIASNVGANVQPEYTRNARRLPSTLDFSGRFYYQIAIGKLKPMIALEAYNLLDTRNVLSVYGDTGKPNLTTGQTVSSNYDPGYYVNPGFYSDPRRVNVTIEIKF
jgi:outer membrane receptor protein involved in Fe transport